MSNLHWSWKEEDPLSKKQFSEKMKGKSKKTKMTKKKRKEKKKRDKKYLSMRALPNDFYSSDEWRSLRYRVLRKYKGHCMLCGRNRKKHNVVLHVDHIKPRSKHPHLALTFDNLQILCEDCNLGKSNKDDTDWRPEDEVNKIDEEDWEELKTLQEFTKI